VHFEETATRVWKRLQREEKLAAARHFFAHPPEDLYATAVGAVIKVRHLRPQVARSLPPEDLARALASVLDPGEPLAAALLVSLHLGERREILKTFLDAAGLPHEDGLLKEESDEVALAGGALAKGVAAVSGRFPAHEAKTYFNTLWLQDPERWGGLAELPEIG
jgi:hypothetical protein